MVASSILPVTIYKNKLFFLFGKENEMEDSAKGFSDFGGSVDPGESIIETAYREGAEELCGFLGNASDVKSLIAKNGGAYEIIHNDYHIHLFFMEYDENLPLYFTNNHRFLWDRMDKTTLNNSKFFEKQEISWFSISDLKSRKKEFRSFYQEKVDLILKEKGKIHQFVKSKNHFKKSRRTTQKIRGGR